MSDIVVIDNRPDLRRKLKLFFYYVLVLSLLWFNHNYLGNGNTIPLLAGVSVISTVIAAARKETKTFQSPGDAIKYLEGLEDE